MTPSSPLARFRRLLEKHGIYDDAIKLLREHQRRLRAPQKLKEDHPGVRKTRRSNGAAKKVAVKVATKK